MKFLKILKSRYCWFVMLVSAILSYFLILKELSTMTNWFTISLSVIYAILFSFSNACLVKDIFERIKNRNRMEKESFISLFATILGYGAFQSCIVGYACTTPLIFSIFPLTVSTFLVHHGVWLLLISNMLLLYSVYKQKCFKKIG